MSTEETFQQQIERLFGEGLDSVIVHESTTPAAMIRTAIVACEKVTEMALEAIQKTMEADIPADTRMGVNYIFMAAMLDAMTPYATSEEAMTKEVIATHAKDAFHTALTEVIFAE